MDFPVLHHRVQDHVIRCEGSFFKEFGYKHRQLLGRGMSGIVTLEVPRDGDPQATKIFPKSEGSKSWFEQEVYFLRAIRHKNIVRMVMAAEDPEIYVIAMPFYPGGDVVPLLPTITDQQLASVFVEVTSAIRYLHMLGIAHRDIKPSNILISAKGEAILTDFGLACFVTREERTFRGFCGTRAYAAPELICSDKGDSIDPFKCDLYALGLVLWSMVVKHRPQAGEKDFLNKLPASASSAPHHYRYLLKRLLHPDPQRRWDSNDLVLQFFFRWEHAQEQLVTHFDLRQKIPGKIGGELIPHDKEMTMKDYWTIVRTEITDPTPDLPESDQ